MKTRRNLLLGATIAAFLFSAGACGKSEEKKTTGEAVGDAINKAVDKAGQAIEKAGDTIKEGTKGVADKSKEVAKEVGDKMREGKK